MRWRLGESTATSALIAELDRWDAERAAERAVQEERDRPRPPIIRTFYYVGAGSEPCRLATIPMVPLIPVGEPFQRAFAQIWDESRGNPVEIRMCGGDVDALTAAVCSRWGPVVSMRNWMTGRDVAVSVDPEMPAGTAVIVEATPVEAA